MSFGTAIATCFAKFGNFEGRASRSEYWKFFLFCLLILPGALILDFSLGTTISDDNGEFQGGILFWIAVLIVFFPSIAVSVRRLHDTDRSGLWFWFQLVPLVGPIMFLAWTCMRGTPGENRFGSDGMADPSAVFE
jgi:uncharacterized membrane protein YhaH (DUF805 family)